MANFEIGQVLGGYEVVGILGQGGMGTVYRVNQVSMDREVALKVLDPKLAAKDDKFSAQFIDEARAAGRLNHPNIIGVHDVSNCDINGVTIYYFSMEIVEGENFKDLIARDKVISIQMVQQVALKITDALKYAEQMGIVHRDIKPENIMITKDGLVKLADLGLALQLVDGENENEDETSSGDVKKVNGKIKVMGTPRYMSPEQCRGKAVDSRTDQYLLGGTLFHMATGHAPYEGLGRKDLMRAQVLEEVPDPAQHLALPEAWRLLLMRMLAKKPEDRIANADQVHEAVKLAIAGTIYNSNKRGARRGARNNARPNNLMLYAIIAVVLLALVIIISGGSGGTETSIRQDRADTRDINNKTTNSNLRYVQEFINQKSLKAHNDSHDIKDYTLAVDAISCHEEFGNNNDAGKLLRKAVDDLKKMQGELQENTHRDLLNKIKDAIQKHRLSNYQEAHTILRTISAKDRETVKKEWTNAWNALNQDINKQTKYYITNIGSAGTVDVVKNTIKECELKKIYTLRKKEFDQAAQQRIATLNAQTHKNNTRSKAVRNKKDRSTWASMIATLARHRGHSDFAEFINAAHKASTSLNDSKLSAAAKAYADIGRRVQNIEEKLATYIKTQKPSFMLKGKPVRCIGLGNEDYIILRTSSRKTTHIKRNDPNIPIQNFLQNALKSANVKQRNNYIAMYLLYWEHPDFSYVANPLPKINDSYKQLKATAARNPNQDDDFLVDFSNAAKWAFYFTGKHISFNRDRLHWFTTQKLLGNIKTDQESKLGLSILTLTPKLTGAVRIDTTLRLHENSLIFVGVKRGQRLVRFALNSKNGSVGIVATNDSGKAKLHTTTRLEDVSEDIFKENPLTKDIQLRINVNTQGTVTFKINGFSLKELNSGDTTPLTSIGPSSTQGLQFIIQSCIIGDSIKSSCELIQLKIQHNR